ncbi:rod shape-determining protein MreC [Thermaurantiacus sp.]
MNDRAPLGNRIGVVRRTSFARRDFNLALIGALVSGVIVAFAILLLILARVDPTQGARARGVVLDVLSPAIALVRAPVAGLRTLADRLSDHFRLVERNRALEAELAAARAAAARSAELEAEVARLDALLKLRRPERRLVASGLASASAASSSARTATVSVGRRHGVRPRMPVLASEGLAGRITDTGLVASRMLLLTDPSSRVPVRVERLGWTGIAQGTGGADLLFQHDPQPGGVPLAVGDRLVTSGDGGLFPPGIPVAVITDIEASPPRARPVVRPSALGPVSVEAPWLPPAEPVPTRPAADEPDLPRPPAGPAPAPGEAPRVQP